MILQLLFGSYQIVPGQGNEISQDKAICLLLIQLTMALLILTELYI
jgi:hypothetical protein